MKKKRAKIKEKLGVQTGSGEGKTAQSYLIKDYPRTGVGGVS